MENFSIVYPKLINFLVLEHFFQHGFAISEGVDGQGEKLGAEVGGRFYLDFRTVWIQDDEFSVGEYLGDSHPFYIWMFVNFTGRIREK